MKYLKLFESQQTEVKVSEICHRYNITDWELNSDGLVDVDWDIDLSKEGLTELPLKFGHVTGFFNCDRNKLTTLEGSPHTVGGYFSCDENQLNSLDFAPKSVDHFYCRDNNIRSFEGLLNINLFYCFNNPVFEIWRIIGHNQFSLYKWDSEKMDFFNDLDIIRGEEIAIERFNFFLEEIGRKPVESVEGYKNIY